MPVLYLAPLEKEENRFLKMLPIPQMNISRHHTAQVRQTVRGPKRAWLPGIRMASSPARETQVWGREAGEENKTGEREGVGGSGSGCHPSLGSSSAFSWTRG